MMFLAFAWWWCIMLFFVRIRGKQNIMLIFMFTIIKNYIIPSLITLILHLTTAEYNVWISIHNTYNDFFSVILKRESFQKHKINKFWNLIRNNFPQISFSTSVGFYFYVVVIIISFQSNCLQKCNIERRNLIRIRFKEDDRKRRRRNRWRRLVNHNNIIKRNNKRTVAVIIKDVINLSQKQ